MTSRRWMRTRYAHVTTQAEAGSHWCVVACFRSGTVFSESKQSVAFYWRKKKKKKGPAIGYCPRLTGSEIRSIAFRKRGKKQRQKTGEKKLHAGMVSNVVNTTSGTPIYTDIHRLKSKLGEELNGRYSVLKTHPLSGNKLSRKWGMPDDQLRRQYCPSYLCFETCTEKSANKVAWYPSCPVPLTQSQVADRRAALLHSRLAPERRQRKTMSSSFHVNSKNSTRGFVIIDIIGSTTPTFPAEPVGARMRIKNTVEGNNNGTRVRVLVPMGQNDAFSSLVRMLLRI